MTEVKENSKNAIWLAVIAGAVTVTVALINAYSSKSENKQEPPKIPPIIINNQNGNNNQNGDNNSISKATEQVAKPNIKTSSEPKAIIPKKANNTEDEYVELEVILKPQNFQDEVYINGKLTSREEGSTKMTRIIKVKTNENYSIKIGECDPIERLITRSSKKEIYPCN